MKRLNSRGFAPLMAILIVVVIGVIGGAGYFVYNSKNKTNQTPANASKAQAEPKKSTTTMSTDATADWTAYSSKEGHFSLKYPKTWVQADHPELCSDGLLLLGANTSSVGKCASDSGSQISVSSVADNKVSDYEMKKADYSDLMTETVVADGVTGQRQTGTYSQDDGFGLGPQKGDKQVKYLFFANNRTYSATYSIKATYPDVLNDFNTMVTRTLKFND